MSSDLRINYLLIQTLVPSKGKIFADFACGFGKQGRQIRSFCSPNYLVGLDIWKPYLLEVKQNKIYDDLVLADITNLPFKNKSVDVSCACEVIEHLYHSDCEKFLASLENISKEKVIISTPNYEYKQGIVRGNINEKHVSVWKDSYFKRNGYKVKGIGILIKGHSVCNLPIIGKIMGKFLSYGLFTKIAELMICIKKL